MCIFKYDISRFAYPGSSGTFDHFSPLNLNYYTPDQLNALGIKHVTESVDLNTDVVQVIK